MALRAGGRGTASIAAAGKGEKLRAPSLPLRTPVIVQLKRGDGSPCWEAQYSSPAVNRPGELKAKSD
jgi:hypothetical protein